MAKILQLPISAPSKFGYKRANKNKGDNLEKKGQLNLFFQTEAPIVHLPSRFSPFEEALMLDERGNSKAKEAYLKAIDAGDEAADAYCNLGILESKSGNSAKAFDCFSNSLKLETRHFESHYNLGNLYFEEEDLKLAKLHYEIAVEIDPAFPNVYFNLGLVHALIGNYNEAIVSLSKFRELAHEKEGIKADILILKLKGSIKEKAK